MRIVYDDEVDVLRIITETPSVTCAPLLDAPDIVAELATEEGYDIVGVTVIWATVYLPLGKRGYDAVTDTLLMGRTPNDPDLVTENGDIVGYWQADEEYLDGFLEAIGIAINRASVHLGEIPELRHIPS